MTFTDTRVELAAALDTIPDLRGHLFRPDSLAAGDAWALLGTADRGPGDAWAAQWRVIVCLGGDERAAQTRCDLLLPVLVDVIDPIAYTQQVTPFTIQTSGGDLFAVELRCLSE